MANLVKKIRTSSGDLQIDYNALANLPTISNPNLLINSDFRNPINQRGRTSYTTTSDRLYTIDRWSIGQGTLTINDASVTFEGNSTASTMSRWFSQIFDHALIGTYIISFNCPTVNGDVHLVIRNNNDPTQDLYYTVKQGYNKFTLNHPMGSFDEVFFRMVSNYKIEIEWIKLEQGTTVTPFIPRLYDEEFVLCLRYYQTINCRLLMSVYTADRADGPYYFQIPMRSIPHSVTVNNAQYFDSDKGTLVTAGNTVANWAYLNNKYVLIRMDRNTADTFEIGRSINALIDLSIDAEIYVDHV